MFEKIYPLVYTSSQIGMVASGVVVDLFLWDQTHSLTVILLYNLGIFAIWPFASLISSLITDLLSLKLTHILSLLANIAFIWILYQHPELAYQPLLLGLVKGIHLGIDAPCDNVIVSKIGTGQLQTLVSRLSALSQATQILVPPIMAFIIYSFGSYQYMLISGIAFSALAILISLFLTYPDTDHHFCLSALLPFNDTNPEKALLVPILFLDGIRQGMFFSLLGIIILYFTDNLESWGLFIFLLQFYSFFIQWLYPKIFNESDSILTVSFASMVFLAASVIFISYYGLLGIIILAIAYKLLTVVFDINLETSVSKIIDLDISTQDLNAEYAAFQEIFRSLGRLVPIIALLLLNAELDNPFIIVGAIAVVGMVPFIMTTLLSRSYVLKHWRDTIEVA